MLVVWFVLWWGSTFVQFTGLVLALQWWRHSPTPAWRLFWLAFVLNWGFTLAHQYFGIVLMDWPQLTSSLVPWCMKLGAMGCELVVMSQAKQLMAVPPSPREVPG